VPDAVKSLLDVSRIKKSSFALHGSEWYCLLHGLVEILLEAPKSISINCRADIGVPSGCQNVVAIMCWMLRSFPSAPSACFGLIHAGNGFFS
jgi:hypothetical protein